MPNMERRGSILNPSNESHKKKLRLMFMQWKNEENTKYEL